MVKIAVKHFVYDFCIDLIFKRIVSNFNSNRITGLPKKGEFYSRVSHNTDDEHYHNCVVTEVEKRINKYKESYYLVTVAYEYWDGEIFEDDEWIEEELEDYIEDMDEEEKAELDEEIQENNSDFKVWHDNYRVEATEVEEGLICVNYSFYSFYR